MSCCSEPDYLGKKALNNLKYYKYGAADKSYLSYYILQPYWSWAVRFFPMWMAPNLITMTGFSFMLANVVLMFYKLPDLEGPTDPWVYYWFVLDCSRPILTTGMDKALLLDFGFTPRLIMWTGSKRDVLAHRRLLVNFLTMDVGGIIQAAAMGFGNSWLSIFVPWIATVAFFFTTWEEYHTGILYLGHINGPTEGLVIATVCMILSGAMGPQIWKTPFANIAPQWLSSLAPNDWTISHVIAASMLLLLIFFQIPTSLYAVYAARRKRNSSFWTTLPQLMPIFVLSGAGFLWLNAPNSVILKQDVALFVLTTGIVFGRIATKIILAYVTKMEYPMFTVQLAPLVVGALLVNSPQWFGFTALTPEAEQWYLRGYFCFVLVAYLRWAWLVIDAFCKHLKIKCFTIPHAPKKLTSSTTPSPTKPSPVEESQK